MLALSQVDGECAYTVGVDANTWGLAGTEQLYNLTFEKYLTAETGCTFSMTLFTSPDDFVAAGLNGSVDVFFAGPGVFACLQVVQAKLLMLCVLGHSFACHALSEDAMSPLLLLCHDAAAQQVLSCMSSACLCYRFDNTLFAHETP